jgi:hypothetical protein
VGGCLLARGSRITSGPGTPVLVCRYYVQAASTGSCRQLDHSKPQAANADVRYQVCSCRAAGGCPRRAFRAIRRHPAPQEGLGVELAVIALQQADAQKVERGALKKRFLKATYIWQMTTKWGR